MPPRAQRLYPRMRERPSEFRVNQAWPRMSDLLAFFTPHPRVARYGIVEVQTYQQTAITTSINFYADIGRFGITGDFRGSNYFYSSAIPARTVYDPVTILCWVCPLSENSTLIGCGLIGQMDAAQSYRGHDLYIANSGQGSTITRRFSGQAITSWPNNAAARRSLTQLPMGLWSCVACTWNGGPSVYGLVLYLNGLDDSGEIIANALTSNSSVSCRYTYCGRDNVTSSTVGWNMAVSDGLMFSTVLSHDEIRQLADPSNVDLRVGNIPLILSPHRRLWPVAPVAEAVFLKRRNLGLRAGTREAVI